MNDTPTDNTARDKQVAAVVASTVVVICFVVYWALEIQAVREMLELAYG